MYDKIFKILNKNLEISIEILFLTEKYEVQSLNHNVSYFDRYVRDFDRIIRHFDRNVEVLADIFEISIERLEILTEIFEILIKISNEKLEQDFQKKSWRILTKNL